MLFYCFSIEFKIEGLWFLKFMFYAPYPKLYEKERKKEKNGKVSEFI